MKKYIVLGHENPDVDSIMSGILYANYLTRNGINAQFVIPDEKIEQENIDICLQFGVDPTLYQKKLELNEDIKFILVDHNIRDNIGEVVEIIDHHPTIGNIKSNSTSYINEPASSTTCLIVQGIEDQFTREEIEWAVVAALVDTASFNSTKTRNLDKQWVLNMCEKYKFDFEKLYKTGLCLTNIDDLESACLHGLKKYKINDYSIHSSSIQLDDVDSNKSRIFSMIDYLMDYVIDNNIDMFAFIVNDVEKFKSTVYKIDAISLSKKEYDRYTSRGNTIIPEIVNEFLKSDKYKSNKKALSKLKYDNI